MFSIYTEKTEEIQRVMDLRSPFQRCEQYERSRELKHIVIFAWPNDKRKPGNKVVT